MEDQISTRGGSRPVGEHFRSFGSSSPLDRLPPAQCPGRDRRPICIKLLFDCVPESTEQAMAQRRAPEKKPLLHTIINGASGLFSGLSYRPYPRRKRNILKKLDSKITLIPLLFFSLVAAHTTGYRFAALSRLLCLLFGVFLFETGN